MEPRCILAMNIDDISDGVILLEVLKYFISEFTIDMDHYLKALCGLLSKYNNHNKLYQCLKDRKNWLMTYNNCEFIKKMYKEFKIIETSWTYGMNKSKESSEIVIICK